MDIEIIVAMTNNFVIGKNGLLPWNIKEDMQLFKEKTLEQTVIMGKNTWLSIPKKFRPLPKRNNIVLSRTMEKLDGIIVCKSIDEGIKEAKKLGKKIFCIGGARLYEEILPLADKLHISWIKKNYEGDTYFQKIDFNNWEQIEEKEFEEFVYKKYERKNKNNFIHTN
jgi:dihydrofolate reductase